MFLWEVKKANLKVVGGWKLRKQCRPGVDTLYSTAEAGAWSLVEELGPLMQHGGAKKKSPLPPKQTNKQNI